MPSGRRSSKRPWTSEHPELDLERVRGGRRGESAPDGRWTVQQVTAAPGRTYSCPGCRQDIGPGTVHLVTWSDDDLLGPEAALAGRRHWHTSCWTNRSRRR